jgi:hypothetical protein
MSPVQLTLADIPSLTGSRPPGAQPVRRRPLGSLPPTTRRTFVKGAVTVGTGFGLAALGVLPPARTARAADGYSIYNACPSYAAGHNCSPGCGPSLVASDVCTPKCTTPCTCAAWFKVGGIYRLRPNQCVSGRGYDGWNWAYGAGCGCCRNNIKFRCHDGWKKLGGSWVKRICKSVIGCGVCNCN